MDASMISCHTSVVDMYDKVHAAGETTSSTAWRRRASAAASASRASAARCARRALAASRPRRRAACAASTPTAWPCAACCCRTPWARPRIPTTPARYRDARPGQARRRFEIKDWAKLELLAGVVNADLEPRDTLPKRVADAIWAEFNRDHPDALAAGGGVRAPRPASSCGRSLGIMPGGVLHELVRADHQRMTNIDGDYVSLALKALRLGVATAYGAQVPLELPRTRCSARRSRTPSRSTWASSTPST